MGKLNKGVLGGFSGRVGPAVGSSWKGMPIIKSRPPRKRGRSSPEQLRGEAKFGLLSSFISPLTDLLNRVYEREDFRMSCFNRAISLNMLNAVSGDFPEFRINYPLVVVGTGNLLNPDSISADSVSAGQLRISWKDNSGVGSARATDQAFAAVYCTEMKRWLTDYAGPGRNTGSYLLDVSAFGGKSVHCYLGFLSAASKFVSTSVYAGEVLIL